MKNLLPLCVLMLAGCQPDETLTAYADGQSVFVLQSIDDTAFNATATIDISEAGKISGQAPCNRYFATQSTPYPWFEAGPIGATRMACDSLSAETVFFTALSDMTLAEVVGDTLILSNDNGREMVFQ